MKKIIIYYNFVLVSVMVVTSFFNVQSHAQIISAIIFFPLLAYFINLVVPQKNKAIIISYTKLSPKLRPMAKKKKVIELEQSFAPEDGEILDEGNMDINRRLFLKLIASAGAGLFMMSLFTKKSHAAFFGSSPTGPGTVAIKDSTGEVIDPAIKTPTDGYKITEIDDDSTPAYYGFVNKDGAWFIMKEDPATTPNYSYTRGDSNFSASWEDRAILTSYDYFDAVF